MPSSGRLRYYMYVHTDIVSGKTQKINNNSLNLFNMYNNPNFVKVKKRLLNKHTLVSIFLHIHVSENLEKRKKM